MAIEDLQFWHQHLGQYLSAAPLAQSAKALVETRLKKGVGMNALGAGIDAHYVVTPEHAYLIGKIERSNTDKVSYIPTDGVNAIMGNRVIAKMIIEAETLSTPFMIGVIGKANPNPSFEVSHTLARCVFCASGAGFSFNLDKVHAAVKLIGEIPWKTFAPAIHQLSKYQMARAGTNLHRTRKELDKLNAIFNKTPQLRELLLKADIRPNSGEYQMLSWYLS